ncbi:MAG: hypothetical protein HYV42_03615 [Candidatus Magasanikbacteria bacterium]|nr:hypothetical protein [Candidatus Magasanikbacteria bacterium]
MDTGNFRSPRTPPGFFNRLGTIHVHVDGFALPLILKLLRQLQRQGYRGKLNPVLAAAAGPQRQDLPEAYRAHTPAVQGTERFACFSTVWLPNRPAAVKVIRRLLPKLATTRGMVVELEKVIGKVEKTATWVSDRRLSVWTLDAKEARYCPQDSLPIEIHHHLEVAKQGSPPWHPEELVEASAALGVPVGGWFLFEKERVWAYRSNAFVQLDRARLTAVDQYHTLTALPILLPGNCPVRRFFTSVEFILGVWNTPLPPRQ